MLVRSNFKQARGVLAFMFCLTGCGSESSDDGGTTVDGATAGSTMTATGDTGDTASETPASESSESGSSAAADDGATEDTAAATPAGNDSSGPASDMTDGGEDAPAAPPKTIEELKGELDSSVSWTDLTVVYAKMHTAFIPGSDIIFQVPANIQDADGATVGTELAQWSVLPEGAVTFDADSETGGVVATVAEYYPEILIAYNDGFGAGGLAELYVTQATQEQWMAGESRYNNDNELSLPFLETAPPFGTPEWDVWRMEAEMMMADANIDDFGGNYECTNCHTTGAKYFEIQHTPTQVARFTDEELLTILTMGKKPANEGFRLLPPEGILGMTPEALYASFHSWDATEEELAGIVIYLRSLTPEGQGDIRLANGEYVAPGTIPGEAGL